MAASVRVLSFLRLFYERKKRRTTSDDDDADDSGRVLGFHCESECDAKNTVWKSTGANFRAHIARSAHEWEWVCVFVCAVPRTV